MTTLELQTGLWQWFSLTSDDYRSYQAIDAICKRLYEQHHPNTSPKEARYQIFYPLIRYGIIEFYGNNQFALSPTTILESEASVLFLHVPNVALELAEKSPLFYLPGLMLYKKNELVCSFLKNTRIPINKFQLQKSLRQFSTIDTIVKGWAQINIADFEQCYYFTEQNKWKPCIPSQKGIYKKSMEVYSRKMILTGPDQWKAVPAFEQIMDAFSIAWIWGCIQNKFPLPVHYNKTSQLLTINTPFFPLLLERLLLINTLLKGNAEIDTKKRQYSIGWDEFNLLNRLFENNITSYE